MKCIVIYDGFEAGEDGYPHACDFVHKFDDDEKAVEFALEVREMKFERPKRVIIARNEK